MNALNQAIGNTVQDLAVAHLVCDTVPSPVLVLDASRHVVAASHEMFDLLGCRPETFIGQPIAEFMAGSSPRFFRDVFWPGVLDAGTAEDRGCEMTTCTGDTLLVRLTGRAVMNDEHAVRQVFCVIEDLTGHAGSEAKFNALFTLSPLPMLVRRLADGRLLDVNPAFLAVAGRNADTLAGHAMEEVVTFEPSHLRMRLEQELRAGRPVRAADMRVKTQDGAVIDVRATTAIIQAFNQRCALLILQDPARGRFDEPQLFSAIEAVMRDTSWFSRQVIEKLAALREPARNASARSAELDDLTKREREVLAMISHGWSDAEIANRLSLTRSTIRNHVAALYGKIAVHSRSAAIVWARERALNVIHPAASMAQPAARQAIRLQPRS